MRKPLLDILTLLVILLPFESSAKKNDNSLEYIFGKQDTVFNRERQKGYRQIKKSAQRGNQSSQAYLSLFELFGIGTTPNATKLDTAT